MTNVYVPDIECDSCVKLISKKLVREGIKDFSVSGDAVTVQEAQTTKTIKLINDLGYRASTEPFERKTFKERIKHFKENKHLYEIERTGLQHSLSIFLIITAVLGLAYIGLFRFQPAFLSTYGWWLLYLVLTVTTIGIGLWHFYAYRAKVTCMTGMMIGMTFGMQTGMMLGAIIGATNGFFYGAMAGMITGTFIGIVTGKCCGVMGVMEGAMAGVMGGTMGPMITVMMFSDHVLLFMPLYMLINIFIVAGMSYMLYEEVVEGKQVMRTPIDFATLAAASIIVTVALAALIVYGPTSALIAF